MAVRSQAITAPQTFRMDILAIWLARECFELEIDGAFRDPASELLAGQQALDAPGQTQAPIHLLPEQLPAVGRHRVRPVMEVPGLVAQGITKAPPVFRAQLKGGWGHGSARDRNKRKD
jgi:hypothetical protein